MEIYTTISWFYSNSFEYWWGLGLTPPFIFYAVKAFIKKYI